MVRIWRSTARCYPKCYLPLLCPCFLGVCCTLKPDVCRLSQVIRRAMRVYIGLQIRHPGFESRRRLSSHPVASCGNRASNACDSLDLGSSAFFVAYCGCSHPVAGKISFRASC